MNEDTSRRVAIITNLVAAIAAALPEVDVFGHWPGDELAPETVFVTEVTGTLDVPVMQAGRHQRNDEFIVTWALRAGLPAQTPAEAAERVAAMAGAIDSLIADDSLTGDDTTVVQSWMSDWQHAIALTAEGAVAYGQATTTTQCRYH